MINLDNRDVLTGRVDLDRMAKELRASAENALRTVAGDAAVTKENVLGVIRAGLERRCNATEAAFAWADARRLAIWTFAAELVDEAMSKEKK